MDTPPAIPPSFIFSASSLQDYVDCPRRFQLRYLQHCDWPAVETEPVALTERHMERGRDFHRLAHQRQLGISDDLLTAVAENAGLGDWWTDFLASGPAGLPPVRRAEFALTIPLAGYRLGAKYDLVAAGPGRAGDRGLEDQHQAAAGARPWSCACRRASTPSCWPGPAAIWLAWPPARRASGGQRRRGPRGHRDGLLVHRLPTPAGGLPLLRGQPAGGRGLPDAGSSPRSPQAPPARCSPAADERRCRFCVYRSLCERQVDPASYDDDEADPTEAAEIALDMEQIAEIVY